MSFNAKKFGEHIFFHVDGYFSKIRHDIFHCGKRPGTGRKHIFLKGFSLRDIKERDIFRKYPFCGHINANSIRFVVNPLKNISFSLWKIFIFTQILSQNLDSAKRIFSTILWYDTKLSQVRQQNVAFFRTQSQPFQNISYSSFLVSTQNAIATTDIESSQDYCKSPSVSS